MSALEDRYLSVKSICERFELKESMVRKAMRRQPGEPGYLRSVRVGRDARRVPESALMEWLNAETPPPRLAEVHQLRRS